MAESRDDRGLFWVDPEKRGVLPLSQFHISRRLQKTLRQNRFQVYCDRAFPAVVHACGERTNGRPETWINSEIEQLYIALFERGFAHSVECWSDGMLVGGLYGVSLGGAFFGESMFSRVADASKVALCHLAARLRSGGYVLLDTQFVTDHLRQFGAVEISRGRYKARLADALKVQGRFQPELEDGVFDAFVHSTTQTS